MKTRLFTVCVTGFCWLLLATSSFAAENDAPLAHAAETRDTAALAALLETGADVNAAQVDGMTALHWAVYHNDPATAKRLIAKGANVEAINSYGVTPLSLACTGGDAALVGLLLDAGANANTPIHGNETPLMTAARTGNVEPVKLLLAHGAEVNAKERKGQTAIMWAAAEGHAGVVQALIDAGAEFRAPLPSGFTPLFFAVREGRIEAVETLLKAGADVNETMQPTKKTSGKDPVAGTSPLILAVDNGHFELANVLVEAGADPNDQRSGYGALHTLTWVRKPNRGDGDDGDPSPIGSGKLSSLDFVRQLVAHGGDVNLRLTKGPTGKGNLGRPGATPFLMAAATADTALMRTLVELGADPLATNDEHCTPLMAIAGIGVRAPQETAGTEPEVLEALELELSLGGDVNTVDDNGETAMHGAAYRIFPLVVQWLADKGAKPEIWNQKNKYGWTPLAIAQGHRFGAFKRSPETIDAISRVMTAANVPIPEEKNDPDAPDEYSGGSGKAKKRGK